jgi:hypothetical protein
MLLELPQKIVNEVGDIPKMLDCVRDVNTLCELLSCLKTMKASERKRYRRVAEYSKCDYLL